MLIHWLQLMGGIALLLIGGDRLVRGASSLARSLGISPLAVGLTVVALGTSAPELAVSVGSALHGSGNLAFGNIFGSNLANIGLIIGLSALLRPLPIDGLVIRRELPMMILAVAAASVMASDALLGESVARYSRTDGLTLLLFFVVFMYYTARDLQSQLAKRNHSIATGECAPEDAEAFGSKTVLRDLIWIFLGLIGLFWGADFTVDGSVAIALRLGIPEVVVGLTVISVGTSLPELGATLSALRQGETALAVGGVVGSNIFNILLICGLTSTIAPIEIPAGGMLDLAFTAILSLALLLTARTHNRLIMRSEGAGLLLSYLAYMVWRSL